MWGAQDRIYQGKKDEEIGNVRNLYGRPAQPFPFFAHGNHSCIDGDFFDLIPGNQFFTVAHSLHVYAQFAEGDRLAIFKRGDDCWQFDACHHIANDRAQSSDIGNSIVEYNLPFVHATNGVLILCAHINTVHVPLCDALPHTVNLIPTKRIDLTAPREGKPLSVDINMP